MCVSLPHLSLHDVFHQSASAFEICPEYNFLHLLFVLNFSFYPEFFEDAVVSFLFCFVFVFVFVLFCFVVIVLLLFFCEVFCCFCFLFVFLFVCLFVCFCFVFLLFFFFWWRWGCSRSFFFFLILTRRLKSENCISEELFPSHHSL